MTSCMATYTCVYVYVCMYMYVYMVCMYIRVHVYTCYVLIRPPIPYNTYIHVCMYVCICMLRVCMYCNECSMTSWMATRSWSLILSNSSMHTTPRSASTIAPASSLRSPVHVYICPMTLWMAYIHTYIHVYICGEHHSAGLELVLTCLGILRHRRR